MKRALRLRSESLAELTAGELGGMAGAAERLSISCPLSDCLVAEGPCSDLSAFLGCIPPTTPQNCNTLVC